MPYDTIANVKSYAATKLHMAAFERATDDTITRATYEATRAIDTLRFKGSKTESDQENEFPRVYTNSDGDLVPLGSNPDVNGVPQDILESFYELTIALVCGADIDKEYENLAITSTTFVSVRSTFDRQTPPEHLVAGIPSFAAWRKLKPYLLADQRVTIRRV